MFLLKVLLLARMYVKLILDWEVLITFYLLLFVFPFFRYALSQILSNTLSMPSWNLMLLTYIKMYVVRFSMFTEVAWFIEEYFLIPKNTWLKMCVLFCNVILHLVFLNNICFLNKVLNFLVNSFCN